MERTISRTRIETIRRLKAESEKRKRNKNSKEWK
jgi:hypothetical protein